MFTYSVGFILGKLLFSYVLVCLACLILAKFNYKDAISIAHGKKGIVAVTLVFIVPFVTGIGTELSWAEW